MTRFLRRGAALATCVFASSSLMSIAGGVGAYASAPPPATSPTSVAADGTVQSEFSLTVSPTRLVVGQGENGVAQKIRVLNGGQSPVSVTVEKRNFSGGSDGTMVLQSEAPYSASDWMTVTPATFDVAPGATQIVTAAISVPAGPEPGDHQVALVFLVPAGQTSDNIKINRGIGTPVYVTVPGPIDDSASLTDLHAAGFSTGGRVTVSGKVHDTGTVHRDFRGATPLTVSGAGTADAFPDFTIMRGSTRDVSTTWKPPLICICHPSVSFVNAGGAVQSATVRVVVFPLQMLAIFLAGLTTLALGARLVRRGYRISVRNAAALPHPVSSGDA